MLIGIIIFTLCLSFNFVLAFDWDHVIPTNFTLSEDIPFSYDFNVTCDESLINYSIYVDSGDTTTLLLTITESGVFFDTATNNDNTATYYERGIVAYNISNLADKIQTNFIKIYVININDEPIITTQSWWTQWDGENFNSESEVSENKTICFTVFFNDIDPTKDELNVTWFKDSAPQASNLSISNPSPGTKLNRTYCFTPGLDDAGEYNISVEVWDNNSEYSMTYWNLSVIELNRNPFIYWHYPSNESHTYIIEENEKTTINITINETGNITFCGNFSDPDNNSMNASWYFDASYKYGQSSINNSCYTYYADYDDAQTSDSGEPMGIHETRLYILDNGAPPKSDYHYWYTNITNVNRDITIIYLNGTNETGEGGIGPWPGLGGNNSAYGLGGPGGEGSAIIGIGGVNDPDGDLNNFSYHVCDCGVPCDPSYCTHVLSCNVSLSESEEVDYNCSSFGGYSFSAEVNYADEFWQIIFMWDTDFGDSGNYSTLLESWDILGSYARQCSDCFILRNNTAPNITYSFNPANNPLPIYEGDSVIFNFSSNDTDFNLYRGFIHLNYTELTFFDGSANTSLNPGFQTLFYNYTFDYNIIEEDYGTQLYIINYSVQDYEPLWDFETYYFNLTEKNYVPDINFSDLLSYKLIQNTINYINLTNKSYDEDNDLSDLEWNCTPNISSTNISLYINNTNKILKLTGLNNFIGLVNITCDLNDTRNISSNSFLIEVITNNPPNISIDTPLSFNFTINESDTAFFNQSTYDSDGDSLDYTWTLDNIFYSNLINISIYFDYFSAGEHNLTLNVTDGNFMVTESWNITVLNLNRIPIYAPEINLFNHSSFLNGNFININYNNNLTLNLTSGNYFLNGYYLSPIIEWAESKYTSSLNYSDTTNNNTNISYLIRTGSSESYNEATWSNWSHIVYNNYIQKVDSEGKYFQYKLLLNTTNNTKTPTINNLSLKLFIRNETLNTQILEDWIDLDNFFYDQDTDDTLIYSVSGNNNILVEINNITNSVTLNSNNNNNIEEIIQLIVNDSYAQTSSQNIKISFEITTEGGETDNNNPSSNRGSTPQYITTNKDIYSEPLEITMPEPITIAINRTVYFIIEIENKLNQTLHNISLELTSIKGYPHLSQTELNFKAKEKKRINGEFLSLNKTGNYTLKLTITCMSPEFVNTEYMYITSVLKETTIKDELISKLKYVEEFISSNNICGELNTKIQEAEIAINNSNFIGVDLILESSLKACKNLINYDIDTPKNKLINYNNNQNIVIIIVGVIILLLIMILVSSLVFKHYKKKKVNKTIKQEETSDSDLDNYIQKFN